MSMNKFMHPRNLYKTPPDFRQLALEYPEFRQFVKQDISGAVSLDFKDLKALRTLSRTLLLKDFDLDVDIPVSKLIPTIPLRLNYVLWLEDILTYIGRTDGVRGVDIGSGASCVYPLLAAKKNNWRMLATEVDEESLKCACENVQKNALSHLIDLVQVEEDTVLKGALKDDEEYDFCMCNPPFFASAAELNPFFNARKISRPKPKNSFCAAPNEVIVKGGEVEFVSRIIDDSKDLGLRVKVYTTMLGHKNSLPPLKRLLREASVVSFCEVQFCQGNTTRWGLAWTFSTDFDLRQCPDPTKLISKAAKPKERLIYKLSDATEHSTLAISEQVMKMFEKLDMTVEEVSRKKTALRYFVTAYSNTWSNQRRKRREKLRQSLEVNGNDTGCSTEEHPDSKTAGKRTFDDCCESALIKKLKISEGESSAFFKFVCSFVRHEEEIFLELECFDGFSNKDYLYQILQYLKNNLNKD